MLPADTHITDWLQLIRAEYLEVPDLCLTIEQARRLWGLDPIMVEAIFAALVDARFLRCTRLNVYVRADTY
jgi:hypothetical protein